LHVVLSQDFSWGCLSSLNILVIQWMQAHQFIQGEVDWNRVGNDTMAWFQSLSAQVISSHIFGTLGIPATSGLEIGLAAGLGSKAARMRLLYRHENALDGGGNTSSF
jgi:hypothetical protein